MLLSIIDKCKSYATQFNIHVMWYLHYDYIMKSENKCKYILQRLYIYFTTQIVKFYIIAISKTLSF